MKITSLVVALMGCIAALPLLAASTQAHSSSVAQAAPSPSPTPTLDPDLVLITPRLNGPILAPYRVPELDGGAGSTGLFGMTGFPAPRVMGFNLQHVPGMTVGSPIGANGDTSANDSVYALGTDYAILVAGGELLHRGSIVNGQRVVEIDGAGVHLSNGALLPLKAVSRPQTTASPSPSPSSSASAAPTPTPSVTATPVTSATATPLTYPYLPTGATRPPASLVPLNAASPRRTS